MTMHPAFDCSMCKQTKTPQGENELGYGTNEHGEIVCDDCCATRDKLWMDAKGKITLYLTIEGDSHNPDQAKVTNWPGTLEFKPWRLRVGRHNIARRRYDVWFNHNGATWHGVTYGDYTQLCHCKRKAA